MYCLGVSMFEVGGRCSKNVCKEGVDATCLQGEVGAASTLTRRGWVQEAEPITFCTVFTTLKRSLHNNPRLASHSQLITSGLAVRRSASRLELTEPFLQLTPDSA